MLTDPLPEWRLLPGVTPGLWQYVSSAEVARNYEAYMAGSPLAVAETGFVHNHLSPPGRLLDLGCGTGRLAIPLARTGFDVVGVDLSHEMLKELRKNAQHADAAVSLLRANLVQLECLRDRQFDYAICLSSTLGMIQGASNRLRFLGHVHRVLRPAGRFVIHVHNRWHQAWKPARLRALAADAARSCRLLPSGVLGHEFGDRLMPYHQGVANLYLHLFSLGELTRSLRRAGFQLIHVEGLGLTPDGKPRQVHHLRTMRAYGYLALARKLP